VQEQNKEPHTGMGNRGQHREARGSDLKSGLARVAARARSHPKEAFNNLMHHLCQPRLKITYGGLRVYAML
jgi:hypothetical protein